MISGNSVGEDATEESVARKSKISDGGIREIYVFQFTGLWIQQGQLIKVLLAVATDDFA